MTELSARQPRSLRSGLMRIAGVVCALWAVVPLVLVLASWARSASTPVQATPRVFALDIRRDRTSPGRTISIVGTRPTPSKGDFIGHMWLVWPETPPGAPPGTRESGWYAHDQLQAVRAMAASIWAPWGALHGQTPVPGLMKADDGWWRHLQIDVQVDEARYRAALAVDARWRRETRYSLRPALLGQDAGRTWGCQDYVADVAEALGLVPGPRPWGEFPMGAFKAFAHANGVRLENGTSSVPSSQAQASP
jgi:hypothetical protein